jgi:hypothetical protein
VGNHEVAHRALNGLDILVVDHCQWIVDTYLHIDRFSHFFFFFFSYPSLQIGVGFYFFYDAALVLDFFYSFYKAQ